MDTGDVVDVTIVGGRIVFWKIEDPTKEDEVPILKECEVLIWLDKLVWEFKLKFNVEEDDDNDEVLVVGMFVVVVKDDT